MKLSVLLVHGIGTPDSAWADELAQRLRAATRDEVARLVGRGAAPSVDELLAIGSVHWDTVLEERQQLLCAILDAGESPLKTEPSWWYTLVHGWDYLKRSWKRLEHTFIAEYVADVIGYLDVGAHKEIHQAVTRTLEALPAQVGDATGQGKLPLTIIAHSLGTVISSDYVWDHAKLRQAQHQRGFHERWRLDNLFTVGSPMALFSLKYGGPEAFKQPISVESKRGRWVNIYDRDDPIGMPLKPLNDAYARVVARDVQVNAGAYLLAHVRYFLEPKTLSIMARKLALDWVVLNRRLPPARLQELDDAYDRSLGIP